MMKKQIDKAVFAMLPWTDTSSEEKLGRILGVGGGIVILAIFFLIILSLSRGLVKHIRRQKRGKGGQ
ncbi:MAG TPA: hypothetical protein VN328_07730 [Thermodesulfovibrionales bacterium]|nr:hypothetical protein [Thermodesulfovibrionales bacterium]